MSRLMLKRQKDMLSSLMNMGYNEGRKQKNIIVKISNRQQERHDYGRQKRKKEKTEKDQGSGL